MKTKMLALYISVMLVFPQPIVCRFFEKKSSVLLNTETLYQRLAALESQIKSLSGAHKKAMLAAALSEDEKNALQQEHNKKIEEISKQIEESKSTLVALSKEQFWWNAAKFVGTAALIGFVAYTAFAAPTIIKQEQPTELFPTVEPLGSKLPIAPSTEPEITIPAPPVPSIPRDDNTMSKENDPFGQKVDQKSIQFSPEAPKPQLKPVVISPRITTLTSQEKALYELRYKNYSTWTGVIVYSTAASFLALGPVAWPVDLALLGIAALSGERALFYKRILNAASDN